MKIFKFICLLTIAMSLQSISHSEPLTLPGTYSGIDDILIPDPPFNYSSHWKEYKFEPIIFLKPGTEELEFNNYVIIRPYAPLPKTQSESPPQAWINYLINSKGAKVTNPKVSKVILAGMPAYQVKMKTNNYSVKSDNQDYFDVTYLLPISDMQIASFSSIRLYNNKDNNKDFGPYWQQFLDSIKIIEPNPYSASIHTDVPLSRKYYFDNIVAIIPKGTERGLYEWLNQQHAERIDHWKTQEGEITAKYKITAGYDFTVETGNKEIKNEKQGMAGNATSFFQKIDPKYNTEHEYLETQFSKDRKIFGYIEKTENTIGIVMEMAYKTGRTVSIRLDGKREVMEKYYSHILEWLKHFVILPDA